MKPEEAYDAISWQEDKHQQQIQQLRLDRAVEEEREADNEIKVRSDTDEESIIVDF